MSPLNIKDMENNLRIIDKAIAQRLTEEGVVNEGGLESGWSYTFCKAVLGYYSDRQLRQAFVLTKYDDTYTDDWRKAVVEELQDRQIAKILLQD